MYDFNDYIKNKSKLIEQIEYTKKQMKKLQDTGLDVSESLQKLDNAINAVSNDKISIVLVGAFSDGKTSVIAGWMNQKMEDMKISTDESSDEILRYTPPMFPNECVIVDTPGLFGEKEGADEMGGRISLSEMTKKYISEANLILYVVTAKNPVKDSHKECIRWILKDLNKLPTTIFVINRMDDVADLTDFEDFAQQERIKTDNLRSKLSECRLSESEVESANVVCISAAPDGKGIDSWMDYREEYLQRSRLGNLEIIINDILHDSRQSIIIKTGCDILNDELSKMITIIDDQIKKLKEYIIPEKKENFKRNKDELESLKKRILRNRIDMKKEIKNLIDKKRSNIRAASMDNYKDILEKEIGITKGYEGYMLEDDINDIFLEYCQQNCNMINHVAEKIQHNYDKENSFFDSIFKQGVTGAALGLKGFGNLGIGTLKNGIFAIRDLLGKFGFEIKFKPWQVTKLAGFTQKTVPLLGAAIDIITGVADNIYAYKKNTEFKENKDNIIENILETHRVLNERLKSENKYIDEFAPQYRILEKQIQQDKNEIDNLEELKKELESWKKENGHLSIID